MSDWDDSWYDDDEFPPIRKRRGRGWIIALGAITFVVCAFNAIGSMCLFFCGFLFALADNNANFLPGDLVQHRGLILLVVGLGSAVSFLAQIVAGVGLFNGRRWARTLSLYLAGYSALLTAFLLYLTAMLLRGGAVNQGDLEGQLVVYAVGLLVHGGYSAAAFLILFNRRACDSLQ